MLWPSILALIAFIIFGIIMGFLFLLPLISVAANIIILYFLWLRIYTEITKYKRGEIYLLSGAASILILLLLGNFFPLWWFTTVAFLAFIITHIYLIFEN